MTDLTHFADWSVPTGKWQLLRYVWYETVEKPSINDLNTLELWIGPKSAHASNMKNKQVGIIASFACKSACCESSLESQTSDTFPCQVSRMTNEVT